MSDEAEEVVPDEPLDTLVDAVDEDVREETRTTSRENLRVYLGEIARIPSCRVKRRRRWRGACARATRRPRRRSPRPT